MGDTDRSVGEQPGRLPETSNDQGPSSSESLHNVDTEECTCEVDGSKDELSNVRVAQSDALEVGCSIVEKVVGSCQLGVSRDREQEPTC